MRESLRCRTMSPGDVVRLWVQAFNDRDVETLAGLYTDNAVNHQVAEEPVRGKEAIREMFASGSAKFAMVCIVENIFEDREWAILEWRDPLGLRGCGFFQVIDGKIAFQRGYWDKLTFLRSHGLQDVSPVDLEKNKALVRAFADAIDQRDWGALDRL